MYDNLEELKKLAGINDAVLYQKVKSNTNSSKNFKPGTIDWFNASFDNTRSLAIPASFRGRRK